MWQGGWPCWGRHRCPAQHSQQECHRLALHCTHRESIATRGTGQGLGCAQGKELERTARAGSPGAAHSTSKAVLLPPGRQPHSPKQGAEKIILPVLCKRTAECYCICTANAIIELSIPQGDHSTEKDAEISDIIFQRT